MGPVRINYKNQLSTSQNGARACRTMISEVLAQRESLKLREGIRTWRKPLVTCPHLKHKAKLEEFKAGGPLRVTRATTKRTPRSTPVKIFSLSLVFSSLNIMYLGVVFSVVVWLGINWGSSNMYLVFSLGISCDKRDKGVFYYVSEVTFVKPLGNLGMRASCQGKQPRD